MSSDSNSDAQDIQDISVPLLKPQPKHHALFVEWLHNAYDVLVVELETTDPESDVVCLALSNALDELASLLSIYDLLREATTA